MVEIKAHFKLAQDFHADVINEPVPVKKLFGLGQLIDSNNTDRLIETAVTLTTEPVIYRTPDGQFEVLNAQQVVRDANMIKLHPDCEISVRRITAEQDLPMARLLFAVVEPAQLFGDIDNLLHAAYSNNHQTALMKRFLFPQARDRRITTAELVQLCAGRAGKSKINNRKKTLGYTQPQLGCKAKRVSTDDTNETCPV